MSSQGRSRTETSVRHAGTSRMRARCEGSMERTVVARDEGGDRAIPLVVGDDFDAVVMGGHAAIVEGRDATCPQKPALNWWTLMLLSNARLVDLHPPLLSPSTRRFRLRSRSSQNQTIPACFNDSQPPLEPMATPYLTISPSRRARRTSSFSILEEPSMSRC